MQCYKVLFFLASKEVIEHDFVIYAVVCVCAGTVLDFLKTFPSLKTWTAFIKYHVFVAYGISVQFSS